MKIAALISHRYEKNCWHFGYFQTHRKQPVLRIWLHYNQIQILVTVYWPAGTAISVSRTASEKQTPATPIVQSPIIR